MATEAPGLVRAVFSPRGVGRDWAGEGGLQALILWDGVWPRPPSGD